MLMPDRDKTIRGLECCNHLGREHYRGGCTRCPYRDPEHPGLCRMQMAQDTLELLGQLREKEVAEP